MHISQPEQSEVVAMLRKSSLTSRRLPHSAADLWDSYPPPPRRPGLNDEVDLLPRGRTRPCLKLPARRKQKGVADPLSVPLRGGGSPCIDSAQMGGLSAREASSLRLGLASLASRPSPKLRAASSPPPWLYRLVTSLLLRPPAVQVRSPPLPHRTPR